MNCCKFFGALVGVLLFSIAAAQQLTMPLALPVQYRLEAKFTQDQNWPHSAMKPWLQSRVPSASIPGYDTIASRRRTWFGRKLFDESLVNIHKPGFDLTIDPLLDVQAGKQVDKPDDLFWRNTRGFDLRANIGTKLSVYSDFRETQARFPDYLTESISKMQTVPSMGRVKPFQEEGFDFAVATAYVSYSPWKFLNVQFGTGSHFLGDGYRSLVLSYNSFSYPYLQLSGLFFKEKLQYTSLFGGLQSLERLPLGEAPESVFKRKGLTLHALSYKPLKFVEFTVFEEIIWKRYSSETGTFPLDARQIIPVPFVNSALFSLQDPEHNSLIGLNFSARTTGNFKLYLQMIADDFANDQFGWQVGVQKFDLLKLFDLRIEYNQVPAFTYSNSDPLQSFTHYNRPLAHPFGAGFSEMVFELVFDYHRWYFRSELMVANRLRDKETSVGLLDQGADPLQPTPSVRPVEAEQERFRYISLELSYTFNYRTNLQIFGGYTNRYTGQNAASDHFIQAGIRTQLHPQYLDF